MRSRGQSLFLLHLLATAWHVSSFTQTTTLQADRSMSPSSLFVSNNKQDTENEVAPTDSAGPNTKLRPGSLKAAIVEQGRVPYGEASRKYRRTVFSHNDWIEHRSQDRILENLSGMFFSGIIRQIQVQISIVAVISVFVVVWNGLLSNVPGLTLPWLPFTLSSPALALLLVFRTNSSYARWWEARVIWQKIVSQSQNIVRMSATFLEDEDDPAVLEHVSAAVWLFCRSLQHELSGPYDDTFVSDVRTTLSPSQQQLADRILQAPSEHVAACAWTEVSMAIDALPIDEKRRVEIDKSVIIMGDLKDACERLYTTPVPLVYTRHTARFLTIWMLLLPAALYGSFAKDSPILLLPGIEIVPAAVLIAIFLFGIEELAVQLEEPFSILPMDKFCRDVQTTSAAILGWSQMSNPAQAQQ